MDTQTDQSKIGTYQHTRMVEIYSLELAFWTNLTIQDFLFPSFASFHVLSLASVFISGSAGSVVTIME